MCCVDEFQKPVFHHVVSVSISCPSMLVDEITLGQVFRRFLLLFNAAYSSSYL